MKGKQASPQCLTLSNKPQKRNLDPQKKRKDKQNKANFFKGCHCPRKIQHIRSVILGNP